VIYLVSNNGRSSLAAGVTAGATSIALAENTGGRFPLPDTGQGFWVRIGGAALNELRVCIGRSGDTLTLNAPLDYEWPTKTQVILPINAELLQAFPQWEELGNAATRNVGTGAGDVAAGNHTHAFSALTGAEFPYFAECTGTVKTWVGSRRLAAGTYAPPSACVGCANPVHAATLTYEAMDGTVLATIGGTPGGPEWHTASAGFTLAALTQVDLYLVTNSAAGKGYLRGIAITG
jgi:hypothetical protein